MSNLLAKLQNRVARHGLTVSQSEFLPEFEVSAPQGKCFEPGLHSLISGGDTLKEAYEAACDDIEAYVNDDECDLFNCESDCDCLIPEEETTEIL